MVWSVGASEGPCPSRAEAERLYRGEDFTLQIDAHSVFVDRWDRLLVENWRTLGNEYAVLSTYPPADGMAPKDGRSLALLRKHAEISALALGSMPSGSSSRRSWKPTAPTTCMAFMPSHGSCKVSSSWRITPKL